MTELWSEEIDQISAALAAAQGEFPAIPKDREVEVRLTSGGKYTFRYATLDAILSGIRPALSKHKLALSQIVREEERSMVLRTLLLHASGQWLAGELPIKYNDDPQRLGSDLSYKRRYGIASLCCIAADEDDDGNIAVGNTVQDTAQRPPKRPGSTNAPKPAEQPPAPVAPLDVPVDAALTALRQEVVELEEKFSFKTLKHKWAARKKYGGHGALDEMDEAALKQYRARMVMKLAEQQAKVSPPSEPLPSASPGEDETVLRRDLLKAIAEGEQRLHLSEKVSSELRQEKVGAVQIDTIDLAALADYVAWLEAQEVGA